MKDQNFLTKIKKTRDLSPLGWGAKSAIWVSIFAYFASQIIIFLPVGIVYLIGGKEDVQVFLDDNTWATFGLMALSASTMIAVLYAFLSKRKLSLNSLGFKKIKLNDIGYVFLFGIIYLIISSILLAIASLIPGFDASQEQEIGFKGVAGWQLIIVFIGLVVIPPLAEEMVFRGFFYRGLSRGWKDKPVLIGGVFMAGMASLFSNNLVSGLAIFIITIACIFIAKKSVILASAIFVSSIFGLVHGQWNVAIDTFALSIVLIALYEKTKNLWACIGLHALKNLVAFIALFVLSGK
ncbi:CPBP family intramembrane metalloprotease [Candidatus Saccharibacteria bacterium]|jgi:membrane protease YdiL (CAAX protease family)|nr:CPBP family intramembrane metalloprotease [Candidatus Saccharibacteria bacterium]MBP7834807.1 CPBP family intramembrane metalloprotease [Candidatus Saccharibacteria bacterium]